jgi:hypothetical protein
LLTFDLYLFAKAAYTTIDYHPAKETKQLKINLIFLKDSHIRKDLQGFGGRKDFEERAKTLLLPLLSLITSAHSAPSILACLSLRVIWIFLM